MADSYENKLVFLFITWCIVNIYYIVNDIIETFHGLHILKIGAILKTSNYRLTPTIFTVIQQYYQSKYHQDSQGGYVPVIYTRRM